MTTWGGAVINEKRLQRQVEGVSRGGEKSDKKPNQG